MIRSDLAPTARRALAGACVLALAGCAASSSGSDDAATLANVIREHRVVLLGEVHDNEAQHALRADALRRAVAAGARPAILLEAFDRDRQLAIDEAAERPGATPDRLIAAAVPGDPSRAGWDWRFYRPYLQIAIEHRLPVVAANVSRADLRQVVADGLAVDGFDPDVPPDIQAAQTEAIVDGHCGQIDSAQAARMAPAQIARDQFMAHALEVHAARGAVLLAGNGHVRRDVGVPRWLAPATRRESVSVGLIEAGDAVVPGTYDRVIRTPATRRDDPCAALRR